MDAVPARPKVFSVLQLTRCIQGTLADAFSGVWLSAEICEASKHSSGHIYLSLKDDEAQIRAVIWRSTAARLGFEPHEGQHVLCCGDVEVYPPRGTYQLIIRQMEPVGLGARQLALQQLRERLAKEGLFAAQRKRPLPILPRRLAFVTSPTGAAIRDFLQVASRRWRGIQLLLIPAKVQGDGAVEEIVRGIQVAQSLVPAIDVLIVGRGGGSVEDLWCFNSEAVVRAIAASNVPVVSAVGHEIDVTLADLAADVRALTPSEAAERIVPATLEVRQGLLGIARRMSSALRGKATAARRQVESLACRRAFRRPYEGIERHRLLLDDLATRASKSIAQRLSIQRQALQAVAGKLESLSPLSVLARGYSVTQRLSDGRIIRTANEVNVGDLLRTRLQEGNIVSRVERGNTDG